MCGSAQLIHSSTNIQILPIETIVVCWWIKSRGIFPGVKVTKVITIVNWITCFCEPGQLRNRLNRRVDRRWCCKKTKNPSLARAVCLYCCCISFLCARACWYIYLLCVSAYYCQSTINEWTRVCASWCCTNFVRAAADALILLWVLFASFLFRFFELISLFEFLLSIRIRLFIWLHFFKVLVCLFVYYLCLSRARVRAVLTPCSCSCCIV